MSAVTLIPKSDLFIVVKTTTLLFQLNYCEHPSILFAKQKQKPNFQFLDHMLYVMQTFMNNSDLADNFSSLWQKAEKLVTDISGDGGELSSGQNVRWCWEKEYNVAASPDPHIYIYGRPPKLTSFYHQFEVNYQNTVICSFSSF